MPRPIPPIPQASRHASGMVLWLTLVAMLFFAALTMYVINLGHHVDKQEATQDAADAASIGAAGEVARNLNIVAHNNIEMTRVISAVQIIDALPQASDLSYRQQSSILDVINEQIQNPPTGTLVVPTAEFMQELSRVQTELQGQTTLLGALNAIFKGLDVRTLTWYAPSTGDMGQLWKAQAALNTLSQSALSTLPLRTELAATASVTQNIPAGTGGAIPFRASIPTELKTFDDFRHPVAEGTLPDDLYAPLSFNRGPFDAVFGWGNLVPNIVGYASNGPATQSSGGSPWGGGVDHGFGGTPIYGNPKYTGYTTYGMLTKMNWDLVNLVGGRHWQHPGENPHSGILANSDFTLLVGRLACKKLAMIGSAWKDLDTYIIIDPDVVDFPTAQQRSNAGEAVYCTYFFRFTYTQSFLNGRSQGPPTLVHGGELISPLGAHFSVPGGTDEGPHVWQATRVTTQRIPTGQTDRQGNPTFDIQEYRDTSIFVFAGMNFGKSVSVDNPNNWTSPPPGPTDFAAQSVLPNETGPGSHLSFLGFASQSNKADLWSSRFRSLGNERHTALAQSRVFNNHSWDLWTPMWHAQLAPITQYSGWLSLMDQTAGEAGNGDGVDASKLSDLRKYLHAIEPMSPLMVH